MKLSERRGPFSFDIECDDDVLAFALLKEWRNSIPDQEWSGHGKDGAYASTENTGGRYYESERSYSGHTPVVSRIGFQPNREETPGA